MPTYNFIFIALITITILGVVFLDKGLKHQSKTLIMLSIGVPLLCWLILLVPITLFYSGIEFPSKKPEALKQLETLQSEISSIKIRNYRPNQPAEYKSIDVETFKNTLSSCYYEPTPMKWQRIGAVAKLKNNEQIELEIHPEGSMFHIVSHSSHVYTFIIEDTDTIRKLNHEISKNKNDKRPTK
jgi:hypothetical protein